MGFLKAFIGAATTNTKRIIREERKTQQEWNALYDELDEIQESFALFLEQNNIAGSYYKDVRLIDGGRLAINAERIKIDQYKAQITEYLSLGGHASNIPHYEETAEYLNRLKYICEVSSIEEQDKWIMFDLDFLRSFLPKPSGTITRTGLLDHDVDHLSGIEFEKLCQLLVDKMGFTTKTTKASGDGGIDLIAVNHEPLISGKYIIQCKRYTGRVGEPFIRDLYGVVTSERANKGILMTTGHFTKSAVAFADGKPIELIDRTKMFDLLEQYGVQIGLQEEDPVERINAEAEAVRLLLNKVENNAIPQNQLYEMCEQQREQDLLRATQQAAMMDDLEIGGHFLDVLRRTETSHGYSVSDEIVKHYTEHPDCILQVVSDNTSFVEYDVSSDTEHTFTGTIFYFIYAHDPKRVASIADILDSKTDLLLSMECGFSFTSHPVDISCGFEMTANETEKMIELTVSSQKVVLSFLNEEDYRHVFDYLFVLQNTINTR